MVTRAIILAAGMGVRLRGAVADRPKGLIAFGGETLVARSIRLLRASGVAHVTIVIGHLGEQYRALLNGRHDVTIVENDAYRSTGSMASLAIGLARADGPVLILESDILYEPRALAAILDAGESATLVSGLTGAGDEVWVDAAAGRLRTMSKDRALVPHPAGEFVGITRLSAGAAAAMRGIVRAFAVREGHAQMAYDTDGLVELAQREVVEVVCIPDLIWGEIDDEAQYRRVASEVWPRLDV
jgi:choline kinase